MPWQNRRGHLSLLRAAILAPPQVFTFASSPSKQAPLEGVDPAAATPNGAWLSLDLVASLLSLASDTELYAQVVFVFCVRTFFFFVVCLWRLSVHVYMHVLMFFLCVCCLCS